MKRYEARKLIKELENAGSYDEQKEILITKGFIARDASDKEVSLICDAISMDADFED
jgi:hypothetical protein